MLQVISGRVWEATGFGFTFVWFPLAGIEVKWPILPTIQLDTSQDSLYILISSQPLSRQEHVEAFVTNRE